jgi:hypothetical protein|tara:strand:- start:1409 stop:1582 length:174 start_codon:yes stop_codon:yes gene_type:complete
MKKKTSKKELEAKIAVLERKIDSFNVLFSMYVDYKSESVEFQKHLKKQMEKKSGIVL